MTTFSLSSLPTLTYCLFLVLLGSAGASAEEVNQQNLRATNARRQLANTPTPAPTTPRPTDVPSPCQCYCQSGDPGYNIIAGAHEAEVLYKIMNYGSGTHTQDCVSYKDSFGYDAQETTGSGKSGYCDTACLVPSTSPTYSSAPSVSEPPSYSPSISLMPSGSPAPSSSPSSTPSLAPSTSPAPTKSPQPSASPTVSMVPSMSPSACVGTSTSYNSATGTYETRSDGCFAGRSDCVTIACQEANAQCCTGLNACVWPDSNTNMVVCPNSCNGREACFWDIAGYSATIREDSCNGIEACKDMGVGGTDFTTSVTGSGSVSRVESHSCDGALACTRTSQSYVKTWSCRGINACYLADGARRLEKGEEHHLPEGVTKDEVGAHIARIYPLPEGVEEDVVCDSSGCNLKE